VVFAHRVAGRGVHRRSAAASDGRGPSGWPGRSRAHVPGRGGESGIPHEKIRRRPASAVCRRR
jgi:hypothetical protein